VYRTSGYLVFYLQNASGLHVVCCYASYRNVLKSDFCDFTDAFGLGYKPKPMRRSQKLVYACGMITLVVLPLLHFQYITHYQIQFDYQRVLEILRTEGKKFLLPLILFTVMLGLLVLKTRIVAVRAMKLKQPKILESPSDNPDV